MWRLVLILLKEQVHFVDVDDQQQQIKREHDPAEQLVKILTNWILQLERTTWVTDFCLQVHAFMQ